MDLLTSGTLVLGSKVLPPPDHGHVYRLLRERRGLSRANVAALVGRANRAGHRRERPLPGAKGGGPWPGAKRPQVFSAQFLGQIERGARPVPESAEPGTRSIRRELDDLLALGDTGSEVNYTLAWRMPDELPLVKPTASFDPHPDDAGDERLNPNRADAVATLIGAWSSRHRVAVLPVQGAYLREVVDKDDYWLLDSLEELAMYVAEVVRFNDL